ncbi:MAG: MFS transporter [Actinomycetota bacterium]
MFTKLKKYFVLLGSILTMVCLGGMYGFSIYVPPLRAECGFTTAQTQLIFGLTIPSFAISLVVAGRLLKRIGPRTSTIISAALFSCGYLISAFSNGNLVFLVLGMGLIAGAGIGFGYASALATPIKWFPGHKGLITGISVAGFGGGAILLSQMVEFLLKRNLPVLDIFKIISISYGAIILLSAFLVTNPNQNSNQIEDHNILSIKDITKNKNLWLLLYLMFSGTFAGVLIIGNLKPIGLSYGFSNFFSTMAISLFAVGNSLGRIIWGKITDLIGSKKSIIAALIFLSISILLLLIPANNGFSFMLISFFIGMGFGANFVLFAAEISNIHGIHNLENIYPSIHLSYGVSGVISPIIGGLLFDISSTYSYGIILASAVAITGALVFIFKSRGKLKL